MGKILDVPKVKQLKGYCGPASLSMVAQYFGHNFSQEDIAKYWKHDVSKGIRYKELVCCAREFGFVAHTHYNLGLEGIIKNIDRGNPIIARVRWGKNWAHFYVIKGYERNPNIIWVNDPERLEVNEIEYEKFAREWRVPGPNKTNQYGIVIRKRN